MPSRWFVATETATVRLACIVAALTLGLAVSAATRPNYGGTLRVEIRESPISPEAFGVPRGFILTTWEAGRRAIFTADDNAPGGRPFLDAVEIQMARPLRDQSVDLELGKADIVELSPTELRKQAVSRRVWSSSPVRLMALVFGPRITDAHVREALALAVDRTAIHSVLLQRQGEISGALLPQWITGYAFVFGAAADVAKAQALVAGLSPENRALTLAVDDPANRSIADRIQLNARDAHLTVSVVPATANADVRLVETRIAFADAPHALASVAAAFGLNEPPNARTPEEQFAAERTLLEGFRVIPLFHLPDVYGSGPRAQGGPVITPLGEWRFDSLWLEERP
jgi:peptide/nickel transport system substrate-binding protein